MIKVEKPMPCKITLSVVLDYDKDDNPIKQKLMDVYATATELRSNDNTSQILTEYREIITGRIIARTIPDRKYLEFPSFQRYGTYFGKLDKTYQYLKIGDIDVEFDKGHGLSGLLEVNLDSSDELDCKLVGTLGAYYKNMQEDIKKYQARYDKEALNDYFDKLDYIAMQRAFPLVKIDQSKPLTYYNNEEYVFIDGDNLLLLRYKNGMDLGFLRGYFYEVVTGRKFAIQIGSDNYMDKNKTFHFDRPFNQRVLASRILSEEKIKEYKRKKRKVISKRIDDVLAHQYDIGQKSITEYARLHPMK